MLNIQLILQNVSIATSAAKINTIKTKIAEISGAVLSSLKYKYSDEEGTGAINFVVSFEVPINDSASKLQLVINKAQEVTNLQLTNYSYM